MADPTVETFCCLRTPELSDSMNLLLEFNSDSYNRLCLASSSIGMVGAIYQILPRRKPVQNHRWFSLSATRGRHIIVWLAVADLLASVGVFLRSLLWLNYESYHFKISHTSLTVLCAFSSAWIQYFYSVTWLWTLFYAIDMRLILREQQGHPRLYHSVSWLLPAVLTLTGLSILYIPDANCHSKNSLSSALLRTLPNYFATYLPMATVMIVNPILYFSLSHDVERLIARSLAQFTNKERQLVDVIKVKFSLINLAFYLCWLPNLINGILIWTLWFSLPRNVIMSLWYIMALMNPLQALFNSLVYRRWTGVPERVYIPCRKENIQDFPRNSSRSSSGSSSTKTEPNESTPLVASSINCSSTGDCEIHDEDLEDPNYTL